MTLSNTREQAILNDIIAGGVYVSLHSGDEGDEPDGTLEVGAADYARAFVPEADLTVSAPDEGPSTISNSEPIEFGTTESDWGTISHGALWTAAQGGTDEAPETSTVALGNSGSAPTGVTVRLNAGELNFSLD